MSSKNKTEKQAEKREEAAKGTTIIQDEAENTAENGVQPDNMSEAGETENFEQKYSELNDSYLRLMAEFDNYRKRTLREKADLIKSGGESALVNLLPVIDDFERAVASSKNAEDINAVIQGIELIYNKFTAYLAQQGVKPIEAVGQPFDTGQFEAVATISAPSEDMKGKVIDCVQTGYILNDKVIRHARVVVGE
jgi:molecular chaperone GrpE